jgi:hypothetical protein
MPFSDYSYICDQKLPKLDGCGTPYMAASDRTGNARPKLAAILNVTPLSSINASRFGKREC